MDRAHKTPTATTTTSPGSSDGASRLPNQSIRARSRSVSLERGDSHLIMPRWLLESRQQCFAGGDGIAEAECDSPRSPYDRSRRTYGDTCDVGGNMATVRAILSPALLVAFLPDQIMRQCSAVQCSAYSSFYSLCLSKVGSSWRMFSAKSLESRRPSAQGGAGRRWNGAGHGHGLAQAGSGGGAKMLELRRYLVLPHIPQLCSSAMYYPMQQVWR